MNLSTTMNSKALKNGEIIPVCICKIIFVLVGLLEMQMAKYLELAL